MIQCSVSLRSWRYCSVTAKSHSTTTQYRQLRRLVFCGFGRLKKESRKKILSAYLFKKSTLPLNLKGNQNSTLVVASLPHPLVFFFLLTSLCAVPTI